MDDDISTAKGLELRLNLHGHKQRLEECPTHSHSLPCLVAHLQQDKDGVRGGAVCGIAFQQDLKETHACLFSSGWTAILHLALLFGHTTLPLADHEKPQLLQDAPQ